jgi:single stranded DNA-binding protein
MAYYLNQFHCMGNLVFDPELKSAGKDKKVCKFRIALNTPYNDLTTFFNVDVWGTEGEKCAEHLKKGAQVFISNASLRAVQYEKSDQDGTKVKVDSVVVNVDGYCGRVQFGPKSASENSPNNPKDETPVKKSRGRPPKKAEDKSAENPVEKPVEKPVKDEDEYDLSGDFDFEF